MKICKCPWFFVFGFFVCFFSFCFVLVWFGFWGFCLFVCCFLSEVAASNRHSLCIFFLDFNSRLVEKFKELATHVECVVFGKFLRYNMCRI